MATKSLKSHIVLRPNSREVLVHIVRADLVYTIREDEVVVFRAHASRFALFSNPKVLKGGP